MMDKIKFWIKYRYDRIVNSIAFYPAFIALLFLIVSFLSIAFDFSESGKQLKTQLDWISLKDASTARSIISVIAGGIISLTVFSFSMVMIVLNQAASQMSNRVLNKLIGNRFQQMVLGIYIGTIVFALFLLSTIRDIDSGIYIPAISTYLLIVFAIVDIFLFIYFLHYITQSVKYEVIIRRISDQTMEALQTTCYLQKEVADKPSVTFISSINAASSGIYIGLNSKQIVELCDRHDFVLQIDISPGLFVIKGLPIAKVNKELPEAVISQIQEALQLDTDETIQKNFFYGFRQLAEIAIKALSPGINDPGTAALCLRALFTLFSYRVCYFPENIIKNDMGGVRVYTKQPTFDQIFETTILPIWDYGKNDRILQHEMHTLIRQFLILNDNEYMAKFLGKITTDLDKL